MILNEQPDLRDQPLERQGEELLGVFQDPTIKDTFPGFRELKIVAISMACRDIAEGLEVMRSSSVGVCLRNGKPALFKQPFDQPSMGNVIFSISWKNHRVFLNWKSEERVELAQDEINAALYKLACVLAETLKAGE